LPVILCIEGLKGSQYNLEPVLFQTHMMQTKPF
jgi:hypothetical protein